VPAWSERRLRDLDLGGGCENEFEGDKGSTCTMSSQTWTMERIRDDFPIPKPRCQYRVGRVSKQQTLPDSPATSTFSFPMAFPLVVKGLLDGI
jgi:hypothetical protein